ncbi:MAG: Hsp20/alpha crystallin family protein [bacterium]|nr:Hsp20/alpha crystallin family protein [bacterium]
MPSFFEKLKNSIGIEEEELEDKEEGIKQDQQKSPQRRSAGEAEKIPVKSSKKEEELSLEQEAPDWFEPEGELAVDVYQTDDEIVIQSTIAGVKPEDLDISIENDTITISGERRNIIEDKGKNYFYQECFWGAFSRQIILPEEVDGGRAEATMKDGVFTLRIPKIERQKIRKVKVRS